MFDRFYAAQHFPIAGQAHLADEQIELARLRPQVGTLDGDLNEAAFAAFYEQGLTSNQSPV